jgi:hypothetical protein
MQSELHESEVLDMQCIQGHPWREAGMILRVDQPMYRMATVALYLLINQWHESLQWIGSPGLTRGSVRRWCETICIADFHVIQRSLDVARQYLLSELEVPAVDLRVGRYDRVKAAIKAEGGVPAVVSLLKPLYCVLSEKEEQSDPIWRDIFRELYQCLCLILRVNLFSAESRTSYVMQDVEDASLFNTKLGVSQVSIERRSDQIRKYLDLDISLAQSPPLSPWCRDWITDALYGFIEPAQTELSPIHFGFSGGATAECPRGTHELDKCVMMMRTGYDPYLFNMAEDLCNFDFTQCFPCFDSYEYEHAREIGSAKGAFVPKSYKADRFITQEPTQKVWFQQGLAWELNDYICHKSPSFRGRFDSVYGPDNNRQCALDGSVFGSMATLDLSSASDSVTLAHIESGFAHLPRLLEALRLARSSSVVIDDKVTGIHTEHICNKYAGMGNPLTFKLEVIVFSAIVCEAIHLEGQDWQSIRWMIVGDDILVQREYAQAVIDRLEYYGFIVNSDKSFFRVTRHHFRESCGMHAVDGLDVTPVYLPRSMCDWRKPTTLEVRKGKLMSTWPVQAIAVANDCLNSNLRLVRRAILAYMRDTLPQTFLPPFCTLYQSGGVRSAEPSNFHLKQVEAGRRPSRFQQLDLSQKKYWIGYLDVTYKYYYYTFIKRSLPCTKWHTLSGDYRRIAQCYRTLSSPWELHWFRRAAHLSDTERLAAVGISADMRANLLPDTTSSEYLLGSKPVLVWRSKPNVVCS